MTNHLTAGAWGLVPRRILESAAQTLPLLLILFIPIVVGMPWLYEWARPNAAASALLSSKRAYLNVPFFLLRSAVLFLAASTAAYLLSSWSRRQQSESPERLQRWMRTLSGPGLVGYGLLTSFVYVDWVMSLTPKWYSTIFGLLIICGQGLSAFAFVIIVLVLLARCPPMAGAVSPKVLHDLGKLLQTFVLLWAYMAFCQLLIIWSGNLPREVVYYTSRLNTTWRRLGLLLVIAHFALPFGLLLFRELKRRPVTLAVVAGWVLVMRLADQLWLVEPSFHPQGFRLHALDVVAPIRTRRSLAGVFLLVAKAGSHPAPWRPGSRRGPGWQPVAKVPIDPSLAWEEITHGTYRPRAVRGERRRSSVVCLRHDRPIGRLQSGRL